MTADLAGRRIGLLSAFASRANGGVFEAVVAHAALVRRLGGEPVIVALDDAPEEADRARFAGAEMRLVARRGPGAIGYAPRLVETLLASRLDLLHLHGIWMYPSAAAAHWTARTRRPTIVSPHGMLDPWITERGRWKKALARAGYERRGWRLASALHALTDDEAADIARETGRRDTLVIPNAAPAVTAAERQPARPLIAYIGRIHAKKNLSALVSGWKAATKPAGAELVIAGWGDPADVSALEAAVAGAPDIRFVGPIFGEAKATLLAEARFVVLPSLSEGLPMAILEAWSVACPTLMTAACHLPDGFAAGAALPCGTTAGEIATGLSEALALDDGRWLAMAAAARDLAAGPFSEAAIAARWSDAYLAALAARPRS